MTNRFQTRSALRARIGDHGPDPDWPTDFLNSAIEEAIRRYSTKLPKQVSATVAVLKGDSVIEVPTDVNPMRVVRVFDPEGNVVSRWEEGDLATIPVPGRISENTWRAWGDEIILGSPSQSSGVWRLEHMVHRQPPEDDFEQIDIDPDDEDILVALALSIALSRRAVYEGKRYTGKSGVHPLASAARTAQNDADRLFHERSKRR